MSRLYLFRMVLLALAVVLFATFVGCTDDDDSMEFLFDREISDVSVLRECAKDADSGAYCYMVRFRDPIDTAGLTRIYMWLDTLVVGDTVKTVDDDDLNAATQVYDFPMGNNTDSFDTIDLTPFIQEYARERKTLMVAIYCDYSSGRPGTVQHLELHFRDDQAPSLLSITPPDSVWTTGALFKWTRPTDQTDYYRPNELSGPIKGYNLVFYSEDKDEDMRNYKIKLVTPDGVDSTGAKLYRRHAQFFANNDSCKRNDKCLQCHGNASRHGNGYLR